MTIRNIEIDSMQEKSNQLKWLFSKVVMGGLTIILSICSFSTIANAGSIIPPSGAPSAQFHTISEIYSFITSNTVAVEGVHDFSFLDGLAGTGHTLTEIYTALASLISADQVKVGTTYLNVIGTLVPSGGTAINSDVLSGKTYFGDSQIDWDLQTGTYDASNLSVSTVKKGTNYGVASTGDYPSNTYPLPGDTVAIDATEAQICDTYEVWDKAGALLTGTLQPTAAHIRTGKTYCGTAGTLLANLFNGTRTTSSSVWPGGDQQFGGVDDFNSNSSPVGGVRPTDSYSKNWTQCTLGNNYCNTSDSGAMYKDDSTDLIWSKTMNNSTYALDDTVGTVKWLIANNCNEVSGNSCTKKALSKTGCEANSGWFLPHQKQFMQAYIDGSYGILEQTGTSPSGTNTYWSATTLASNLANGWSTNLSTGNTSGNAKTSSQPVRCVRSAL